MGNTQIVMQITTSENIPVSFQPRISLSSDHLRTGHDYVDEAGPALRDFCIP